MIMSFETALGLLAGSLTTIAFLPQVIRTWRTRSTADISLVMFLILCTGIALWLVYGLIRGDWPVIIANGFTLVLASTILFFKLRHG
ncbi:MULTISPECIES: SemiSWEET transporter [Thalassospira]|uniref:MtN3 and saliva related transmembrane protein n=2 Tax=Thalassospira xiamenensis TaxID=220697 RepID=A0A285RHZ4_9PROT|nr:MULTISPECIES: SemiSWEET transporter [Thalassospira]MCH2274667.1 SemiSWEET transporter [Thalassospira sp.]SOB93755.1 MtN3 and saliva related transmembrane protein [Thalassospira xiamenensis]